MRDISKIDGNFKIKTDISRDGLRFYDVDSPPFALYGVRRENGKYRRMPESVAKSVSEGVYLLHSNTAGGRVRFVTDSPYIAIHAEMDQVGKMPHFALTGSAGFGASRCSGSYQLPPSYHLLSPISIPRSL